MTSCALVVVLVKPTCHKGDISRSILHLTSCSVAKDFVYQFMSACTMATSILHVCTSKLCV